MSKVLPTIVFRELAAASRELGGEAYAEIFGFDDGEMPRYILRGGGNIELASGATLDQILDISRAHCKSPHFVRDALWILLRTGHLVYERRGYGEQVRRQQVPIIGAGDSQAESALVFSLLLTSGVFCGMRQVCYSRVNAV